MMRAHLSAISAIDLAHLLLDERMPRLAEHGHTAVLADDVHGIPGEPRIVHDASAGLAPEEGRGQQAHQIVAFDELTLLVEEKAPVVIAVPREPHVRPRAAHG